MTLANFAGYRSTILKTDLDPDSFGVIMSPDYELYLGTTVWAANSPDTLLDKIRYLVGTERMFVGNEIAATAGLMASGKGFFAGLWRFLYIMLWGDGIEVSFDKVSAAGTRVLARRTIARISKPSFERICSVTSE
jgi:hypothetical protein